MNKLNYLFADCVSHHNTLKINRQLNDVARMYCVSSIMMERSVSP